ncbi:MAG TPA: MBL fold metallo-hydrolase [Fodinibius sp.]|nr:MBL fold metallo-hydrolase [Fodinibius sp.]
MGSNTSVSCTFWGVRGSVPCPYPTHMAFGGNTTCVQIALPDADELLILDSGTGIRKLGEKLARQNHPQRGHVFISHPHWDHLQGFPFFRPFFSDENHFTIHMPRQKLGGCRDILNSYHGQTFFPVSLDMLKANLDFVDQPQELRTYGSYGVEYMRANHGARTAIYKLHFNGKTLVFAPDNELVSEKYAKNTSWVDTFTTFIVGADLLIHDAQYDLESYGNRQGWGHSPWQEVARVAAGHNVKRLALMHHDPGATDAKLLHRQEQLQRSYGDAFIDVRLVREGETIVI